MSGFWLISYIILWLVVIGGGLAFLTVARETESLHKRIDSLEKLLRQIVSGDTKSGD